MINKEYGSDFHHETNSDWYVSNYSESFFLTNKFTLFFSGRAALGAILKLGIKKNGWKKLFVPSYYCHEVIYFIKKNAIEICYYDLNPFDDFEINKIGVEDSSTNVVLIVNFFGFQKLSSSNFKNAMIIEDLTHNILSYKNSTADFCFGSLRKELPVPVGGFCYSPSNKHLPEGLSNEDSDVIALQKLTAMFLKNKYLVEGFSCKKQYRSLFLEAENLFEKENTNARIPDFTRYMLLRLDVNKILNTKKTNMQLALSLLKDIQELYFKVDTGFGLIFLLPTNEVRTNFQNFLVQNNIFPAVLWPNQFKEKDVTCEKNMLFIHLDYRYSNKDVIFITDKVKEFFRYE